MNNIAKYVGLFLLLLIADFAVAQEYEFKYKRSLEGITDTWHQVNIPIDAYGKLNEDFSDVRILGFMENGDTIEAPYILKLHADNYENETLGFKLINQVNNKNGYYYTFKLSSEKTVNYLELSFNKQNFDWLVALEGSQNQQEWFTVLKKSRIIGIQNNNTSYKYTTLYFDDVNYKYLRLKVPSSKNPRFKRATMEERTLTKGIYNVPEIQSFIVSENDDTNDTELRLTLKQLMPISYINVVVKDSIDYYRPISVEYAIDSIENNTGWHYIYKHLFNGTLSSLNRTGYNFQNQVVKHLRVTIDNYDNEPLSYEPIQLHGNTHSLIARFSKPATYYLVYGKKRAYVPNYDITRFEDNIPTNNKQLKVGDEIFVEEEVILEQEALFNNDIWLWAIMIFVIFILGWFSLKMLKN